jgi:hypothetical protein
MGKDLTCTQTVVRPSHVTDSAIDANFYAAVSGQIGENVNDAGHYATGGFNASYHGDPGAAAGQDATAQSDPMDLDFDFDAALWAGDFYASANHFESEMNLDYGYTGAMPPDFLFAEDEGMLPAASSCTQPSHAHSMLPPMQPAEHSPTRTVFSVPRSDAGSDDSKSLDDGSQNGVARQRLRRQLSLLSKGWAGDEIRFKNCDSSKAVVLHSLAMELGLGYNHDVRSREVSMSRLEPAQVTLKPQPPPGRLSSSFSRSSTELDSTLCLPGLPSVPEYPTFEPSDRFIPESRPQSAKTIQTDAVTAPKDQPLMRRPSRGERISDSISKHVSTIKTSIVAKGGRRGPLTENGRRDMRALEAAGGACWRCKVLRRKVSPTPACVVLQIQS